VSPVTASLASADRTLPGPVGAIRMPAIRGKSNNATSRRETRYLFMAPAPGSIGEQSLCPETTNLSYYEISPIF